VRPRPSSIHRSSMNRSTSVPSTRTSNYAIWHPGTHRLQLLHPEPPRSFQLRIQQHRVDRGTRPERCTSPRAETLGS
jgi:hypothetical protein